MTGRIILTSAVVLSIVLFSDNIVGLGTNSDGKVVQHLETTELKDTMMDTAKKTKKEVCASKIKSAQMQKQVSDLESMIISTEKEVCDRKKDAISHSMLEELIELENTINNIKQEISVLKARIEQCKVKHTDLFNCISNEQKKRQALLDYSILNTENLNSRVKFTRKSSLGNFQIRRSSKPCMQEIRVTAAELFNQQGTLENLVQGLEAQISELKNQFESNKSKLDNLIKEKESKKQEKATSNVSASASFSGKSFIANATAYSCQAASMGRFSCYGIDLLEQPMVVAVDPKVIPLGSKVRVDGYGEAIAGDTGSAIKENCIDLHFPTYEQSCQWGRRYVRITVLS